MKLLDFPNLQQLYEYDCGACALQAVLIYYGVKTRRGLIMKCAKTHTKTGTLALGMKRVLKKFGLKCDDKKIDLKKIKRYIDKKIPILLLLQAWHPQKVNYAISNASGHWVVAIGYDKNKIIFEDPYVSEKTYLTKQELKKRWHAKENGKIIMGYAIAVSGKKPTYNSKKIIAMK